MSRWRMGSFTPNVKGGRKIQLVHFLLLGELLLEPKEFLFNLRSKSKTKILNKNLDLAYIPRDEKNWQREKRCMSILG